MPPSLDPTSLPDPSSLDLRDELPDPFQRFRGPLVESTVDWQERRAELKTLFQQYMYGYAPSIPTITVDVGGDKRILDGRAKLREVTISFPELPEEAPSIHLAMFLPLIDEPVPVILGLNKSGNHTTVSDEEVSIPPATREFGADGRGGRVDYWCIEQILDRGYALATFHCADIDPDRDNFSDGIHPFYDDSELDGPPGTEWGTIAAWAWGLHRCVDYLESADGVDEDQIAVFGHSRRGKTALLAGGTDERIALVIPHQSGTGGCVLSRDNDRETVDRITSNFPHWFNSWFERFSECPDRLPIDQHLLIALVAPRPLLDTEGTEDYWAHPDHALNALQAAAPVYEFLGERGIVGDGLLREGDDISAETTGTLLQYRRETDHTLNAGYWNTILDFADLHFE